MTEGVIIALIGAGQAITLGILTAMGTMFAKLRKDTAATRTDAAAAKKDAAAARYQVENNHDTNLREENDSRHEQTRSWINELSDRMAGLFREVRRDIGGMREELRQERQERAALAERVTIIERKDT